MMLKDIYGKKRKRVGILLLLSAVIFSACSLRMTYNYLDWIIPWYVDDYVNLTAQQEEFFDQATIELLGWHRSEELPRYTGLLTAIKDAQKAPMIQQEVLTFFDQIAELWQNLLKTAAPHLAVLARQLTDGQISQINEALLDKHAELEDEYGSTSPEQRDQERQEKTAEFLADWLGSVNEVQLQTVAQWSGKRNDTIAAWLAYRDNWRIRFIELLESRDAQDFSRKFEEFLLNPDTLKTAAYIQATRENRFGFAQFIADISAVLSSDQRTHLHRKLAELVDSLNDLSIQNG